MNKCFFFIFSTVFLFSMEQEDRGAGYNLIDDSVEIVAGCAECKKRFPLVFWMSMHDMQIKERQKQFATDFIEHHERCHGLSLNDNEDCWLALKFKCMLDETIRRLRDTTE